MSLRLPIVRAAHRRAAANPCASPTLGYWFAVVALLLVAGPELAAAIPLALTPLQTRIDRPVSIPAEVAGRGLFVDASINGRGPFHLLVDTGCSCSLISPEVALALGLDSLDAAGSVLATNALGDSASLPQVMLDSVELGGVRFEGVPAGIVSFDLQSQVTGRRLDGILGYSLFTDLFLTFDFPGHRLRLSREWPAALPPVRTGIDVIEDSGVPLAAVAVQDRTEQVIVDTGSNSGLQLPLAREATLAWKASPRPGALVGAVGGVERERTGRLAGSLSLGAVRQEEPVVSLSAGAPSLGVGFFESFSVVFHAGAGRLWLCSPGDGAVPSPAPRSVGLSLVADQAGWRVVGIIPHSPAESARFAVGDVIAQIEHQPARDWTPDRIQAWLDTHKTMTLGVAAAGGVRDIFLPVWSVVP